MHYHLLLLICLVWWNSVGMFRVIYHNSWRVWLPLCQIQQVNVFPSCEVHPSYRLVHCIWYPLGIKGHMIPWLRHNADADSDCFNCCKCSSQIFQQIIELSLSKHPSWSILSIFSFLLDLLLQLLLPLICLFTAVNCTYINQKMSLHCCVHGVIVVFAAVVLYLACCKC